MLKAKLGINMRNFIFTLLLFIFVSTDSLSCNVCKDPKIPEAISIEMWLDGSFIHNNFSFDKDFSEERSINFGLLGRKHLGSISKFFGINDSILSDGQYLYIFLANKLVKFDPAEDKILWYRTYASDALGKIFFNGYRIQDGNIYLANSNGILYKIDLETGSMLWFNNISLPIKSVPVVFESIKDNKDYLYVLSSNDIISKLDAENGLLLESNDYSSSNASNISELGISNLVIYNNNLITSYSNGQIIAIDLSGKNIIWSNLDFAKNDKDYSKVVQFSNINHPIFLIKDKIYAFSKNSRKMGIINAQDGKTEKLIDLEVGTTNPLHVGNLFFVLDKKNNLRAVSENGDFIWTADLMQLMKDQVSGTSYFHHRKIKDKLISNDVTFFTPIMLNKSLVLFSDSGVILVIDAQTGEFIDFIETQYYFANKPMIMGDTVYLLTSYGRLFYLK